MLNTIRPLIGQSKTREALEVLTEFLRHRDKELFNECFTQLGRYNHVSQERRRDLINFEDYTREVNRINFALVEMLQQAERDFKTPIDAPIAPSNIVSPHISTFEYTVFLSFSSHEREAAFAVFERLTQAGIKTFFSGESLKVHSGQAFSEVIANALENSQHFILLCSPKAMQSTWVKIEWDTFFNECHVPDAQNRRFFILKGVDFEQVRVPILLKRLQYADNVDSIIHSLTAENKRLIAIGEAKKREEEAKINAEIERKERERLAILAEQKAETERRETERKERERLIILAQQKAETERLEAKQKRERLAALAQAKEENERLETERKRLELLAQQQAETERKERERLAILAQQNAETERLDNERKEREHLVLLAQQQAETQRLEAENKERDRLAALEKARKKQEKEAIEREKKQHEAERIINEQRNNDFSEPSFFQKNRMAIGATGLVTASLLVWQLNKPPQETPLSNPTVVDNTTQPIVAPQPKAEPTTPTHQGTATINPKTLPPNVVVGKTVEKKSDKTTPSVSEAQNVANTRWEQEEARQKAEKAEAEKRRRDILAQAEQQEKEQAQRQMKAVEMAKDILQSALASFKATEYGDVKTYLSQAAALPHLPEGMKKVIGDARAYISAGEYEDAKVAIQRAKTMKQ
jgi:TIR domain/Effector-associated domain 11